MENNVKLHNEVFEEVVTKVGRLALQALNKELHMEKRIDSIIDIRTGVNLYFDALLTMTKEELVQIYKCETCPNRETCTR